MSLAGSQVADRSHFGEGTGRIWLSDVACTGTEKALIDCTSSRGANSCTHAQDSGVWCSHGMVHILK